MNVGFRNVGFRIGVSILGGGFLRRALIRSLAVLCALACGLGVNLAQAIVPGQINYQGLLLDDLGVPVTGPVDMAFRLYSVETGGSELWAESHAGVDVLDGVYEVALGSDTPLTPSLLAGGAVYLEIEVETEILTPRQRLLAVPYALLAEEANEVGGVSSLVISEIYEHFSFDGQDPPNDDPSEGSADIDGDGIANFIDADNDNDGILDGDEVNAGSNINLVTPILSSLDPMQARACATTQVHVTGSNFDPGLSVIFGSESPTPQNVTSSSFDVSVGPQSPGNANVTVSIPNGEQDTAAFAFAFGALTPTITILNPSFGFADLTSVVEVVGTNFETGLTVSFGGQNVIPTDQTSTSFKVTVGPQPPGVVTVTVTNLCGEQTTTDFGFVASSAKRVFVSSGTYDGNLGGIGGADAICNQLASNAGLPGFFLAWLSDGVVSPDTRFSKNGAPYALVDDTVIAADWADLTDGALQAPIGVTELNGSNSGAVFSNVKTDGTTKSTGNGTGNCAGWTDVSSFSYNAGSSIQVGAGWTDLTGVQCSLGRLYCFEQ